MLADLFDFGGRQPEDEDIIITHPVLDLDIGAIQRADGHRPIHGELHVAGARCLHASSRYLLREVGGRDQTLGQTDIVVGQKQQFQPAFDQRIVVDQIGRIIGEFDDQFGPVIGGSGFACDDFHPRLPIGARIIQNRLIMGERFDDV